MIFQAYIISVKEILIDLFKVFILMNTWIVGIDLMKHHYLIRSIFTVA